MFLGILGGMAACVYGGYSTMSAFIDGIQTDFYTFSYDLCFYKDFYFCIYFSYSTIISWILHERRCVEVGKASKIIYLDMCNNNYI